jgi:hypothetical protein
MNRRGFLKGILAAGVAPYVVTAAGVLMPVRTLARPIFDGCITDVFFSPYYVDPSMIRIMQEYQLEINRRIGLTVAMLKGAGKVRFGYDLVDYGRAGGASFSPASS